MQNKNKTRPDSSAMCVLVLCWAAYLAAYLMRSNLSVALPLIENQLQIDKVKLGLLSSIFFWLYGVGQLVNGSIGDRVQSKLLILIGLAMAMTANLVFGLGMTLGFGLMAVCWAANGWFQSMLWGPIAKTVDAWSKLDKRSTAMIGVSTSATVGSLFSLLISGRLAQGNMLSYIFILPAVLTAVLCVVMLIWFRSTPAHTAVRQIVKQDTDVTMRPSLWRLIIDTRVKYMIVACFAQAIVKEGIALWSPIFFMEQYDINIGSVAVFILFIPIMNFLGVLFMGWLIKRLPNRLNRLITISFVVGTAFTAGLCLFGSSSLSVAVLCLALSSASMYAANTLLLGVYPLEFSYCGRVSSISGFLEFCSYTATGISAVLVGMLAQRFGWSSVMLGWLAVIILGLVALLYKPQTSNHDSTYDKGGVLL